MNRELEAQVRSGRNKSQKKELLKSGFIPGVVYGKNMDSIAIAVKPNELKKILAEAGSNALINMKIRQNEKTSKHQVLVKSVQCHPVNRTLIHADFHQVSLKDKVNATININLTGDAPGVDKGGILSQLLWRFDVECLASSIPDTFVVDVSSLEIGEGITLGDLVLPPGVKIQGDENALVVSVTAGRAVEDEQPEKEEEEVIV